MLSVFSTSVKDVLQFPSNRLTLLACGLTVSAFSFTIWKLVNKRKLLKLSEGALVVITGCDSGLGYSMALHCSEIGFHVIAGVLSENSKGAEALKTIKNKKGSISVVKLDVTDFDDIKKTLDVTSEFLSNNPLHYLHGIINNAGVMIFGEYEWLTNEMIFQQLNVNLLGAMYFTKAFLPLLRKYKGRIINVTSHCALAPLPGLSVYAATKSGMLAWNDAIRVECASYGIKVISFIPGSFYLQSNILSRQSLYASKMKMAMSEEATEFYGDYFARYQAYIGAISGEKQLQRLHNNKVYQKLTDALTSVTPSATYCTGPFRYNVYHLLFRITPCTIRDYLVKKFMQMPTYK